MHVCFVLLANSTARNVLADKGGKTRPPKLRCDELAGFKNSRVSGSGVVMVMRDNRTAEVRVSRDINTILKG